MMNNNKKPHSKNLRNGRVSLPHQIYHITAATCGRRPIFTDFYAARILVMVMMQNAKLDRAATLAYVVMPDHFHWLMQLGTSATLSKVVGGVKSVCAHRLGRAIWQAGFHDHALRHDEDMVDIARYIVANPLRAGLVKRLGDYPHWDAVWV